MTERQKFDNRVDRGRVDECWIWLGATNAGGYGTLSARLAHRLAWSYEHGPIPDGMVICHRCDNPPCVNPAHLFVGTQADNAADRESKGRNAATLHPERIRRGSQLHCARLTEEEVAYIKTRLLAGETISDLARKFGVDSETVGYISRGKTWRHVLPAIAPRQIRPSVARRGEFSGSARLNLRQVDEIRQLWHAGGITKAELGRRFAVTPANIRSIVEYRTWVESEVSVSAETNARVKMLAAINNGKELMAEPESGPLMPLCLECIA